MATVLGQRKRLFDEPPLSKHDEQEQHGPTPAELWDRDVIRHALDELVNLAFQYKSSKSCQELIRFVGRFRFYSPYNAMLVHIQMPGAQFVAPAHRWIREYGRRIKPNAHPLVILRPRGPVMFVFDVGDTEPGPEAHPLPPEVENLLRSGVDMWAINWNGQSKMPSEMVFEFCYRKRVLNRQVRSVSRTRKAFLLP